LSVVLPPVTWDEARDAALEVQERVQLDGAVAPAELGPGKERERQIDGRRVQRVGGRVDPARQVLVGVDAPVAPLVGIGEGAAGEPAADPHVIELGVHRGQAGDDVAERFAEGQLGEGHGVERVAAVERADLPVAAVPMDAGEKAAHREVIHDL